MKVLRVAVLALVMVSAGTLVWGKTRPPFEEWHNQADGYQSAKIKHERFGKPMLIYFYADWCPHCQRFEKGVLADPKVKQALRNLVPVAVNPEGGRADDELAGQFGVTGFPTLFLKLQGQQPRKISRADTPGEFVALLDKYARPEDPRSAEQPVQAKAPQPAPKEKSVPQGPQANVYLKSGEAFAGIILRDQQEWLTLYTDSGQLLLNKADIIKIERRE